MKTVEEAAKETNEKISSLEEAVKNAVTPEQLKEATDALEAFKTANEETLKGFVPSKDFDAVKAQVEKLESDLKEANLEMVALQEKNKPQVNYTFKGAVQEALKENHEKLVDFVKNNSTGNGGFKMQIKVPEVTTTGHITPTGAADIFAAQSVSSVSPVPRQEIFVEDYFDVGSTDLAAIPYVDELPGEGDAAIVAEGALKPLIDVDYVTSYSQPRKVAGIMKVTDEALYDYKWLESAMTGTLKRKHDIARQADLLGANGLDGIATAFNAAILNGIKVDSPQHYDAIAALVAGMANSSEGVYIPNVVFVNTMDNLDKMLTKDADGNYIMPPFADANGNIIDGVRIVAKPSIAAGTFVVGDFRNVKLRNMWDYNVTFGWENDDFTKNQVTMVGESRYHLYCTTNDKRGIIKGTFADVITALTTV